MSAVDCGLTGFRLTLNELVLPAFVSGLGGPPRIVAIEGPNGVGKSTLCKALAEALPAECCLGIDGAWFAEPFKTRMIRDADWLASAMFFLSGCLEQMRRLRESPAKLVIMDRCLWSTLAVQAATEPARLRTLLRMLEHVEAEVRVPDFTLVLEASFATCQERIARKTGAARALDELTATAGFHAREHCFYHWLSRSATGVKFLEVDKLSAAEAADAKTASDALELVRAAAGTDSDSE